MTDIIKLLCEKVLCCIVGREEWVDSFDAFIGNEVNQKKVTGKRSVIQRGG